MDEALVGIQEAAGSGKMTLGDLLDSFEDRSLGFLVTIAGLLVAIPVLGAIPGMPNVSALIVVITVFHSFVGGQTHFWAPDILRRREVDADRVQSALERIRPLGKRIDALLGERMQALVATRTARSALALTAAAVALAMVPISFVPFLSTLPAFAITVLGLALMGRDGLVALLGYVLSAATLGALFYAVMTAF